STGSRYILRFEDFESEYELQALIDPSQGDANVQMFSLGVPAGRQPDRSGTPPAGFAMTLGSAALGVGTTRSILWDDVQLVAQPSGGDINNVVPRAEHDELGVELGFAVRPPMNYTADGFWNLLETQGPVLVGKSMGSADGNTHIVVVVGMLDHNGTCHVRVLD